MNPIRKVANTLVKRLNKEGVPTRIFKEARTGSVYIRFRGADIGQCRVGDHDERRRLGYRWQVRLDLAESTVDTLKGHKQFYYAASELEDAISHIRNYYNKVKKSNE